MKAKYRLKLENGLWYAQKKTWLTWKYLVNEDALKERLKKGTVYKFDKKLDAVCLSGMEAEKIIERDKRKPQSLISYFSNK